MKKQIDERLIRQILPFIEKAEDNIEEHFAFAEIQPYFKKYILELQGIGYFDKEFKHAKQIKKEAQKKGPELKNLFNIMTVNAVPHYKGSQYIITAKLTGSVSTFIEAVRKKNMRKYTNNCGLMYLDVKMVRPGEVATLIQLGDRTMQKKLNHITGKPMPKKEEHGQGNNILSQ